MGYVVGIDLGTTFTAAAVWRDGSAQIASLGSRGAAIPSVVLLREDETELTGEAADRRAMTEPERVAREFKRRLGDTTPILVGGSPYSSEALMARLLRAVVDDVTTREGGPADAIAVCHPANWGPYKIDLLRQGIRLANLPDSVTLLTEPEAAAIFYATQQRLDPGQVVAVYDLGGGTFDAAVLRRTETGFEILGQPEGIERLGGIDFDAAVFAHVRRSLGEAMDDLDEDDPAIQNAVARLRADCIEAKEALSSDTDASIPVLLPNIQTEVRITRAEFEAMIRPTLVDSVQALHRALRSAQVEPENVAAVLLVGGSSRIPLVARLVGAELGRPVAVDAHPKHAIALGAALAAGVATIPATPAEPPVAPSPVEPGAAAPPPVEPAAAAPPPVEPAAAAPPPVEPAAVAPAAAAPVASGRPGPPPTEGRSGGPSRGLLIGIAAAVVVVIGGVAVALSGESNGTTEADEPATEEPATEEPATEEPTATEAPATTEAPVCPDATTALCIDITDIQPSADGLGLVIEWEAFGFTPSLADNHAHFYWNTSAVTTVGTQAPAEQQNPWDDIDAQPYDSTDRDDRTMRPANADGATAVCATPADRDHAVIDPMIFDCFDLPTA